MEFAGPLHGDRCQTVDGGGKPSVPLRSVPLVDVGVVVELLATARGLERRLFKKGSSSLSISELSELTELQSEISESESNSGSESSTWPVDLNF